MPDSVKRPLVVYKVVEQITLVLYMLLCCNSAVEHLFYCASAWSVTCLFFCQQFLSLGLESDEDNSEHALAGMADQADDTIVPQDLVL